MGCDAQLAVNL